MATATQQSAVSPPPVKELLFKAPSFVLRSALVQTFREYASVVFRCLQKEEAEHTLELLTASFVHKHVACCFIEQVKGRINATLPCIQDKEEHICILPALFMQSEVNQFCELVGTPIGLVLFDSGPIFPFVRISPSIPILGNTTLSNALFRLYELMPEFKIANDTDVQNVCDGKKH